MGGRNYARGRAYEYKTMAVLRNWGYAFVMRSASSHGPIDVIAVGPPKPAEAAAAPYPCVLLVQVKSGSGRLSKEEKVELAALASALGPACQVAVWYFKPQKGKRISNKAPKIRFISREGSYLECVITP